MGCQQGNRVGWILVVCASLLILAVHAMASPSSPPSQAPAIRSSCACGRLQVTLARRTPEAVPKAVDCRCPSCRSYHQSAFGSFLTAAADQVQISDSEGAMKEYTDTCQGAPVTRVSCRHCHSKLLTRRRQQQSRNEANAVDRTTEAPKEGLVWLNMGPLLEESLPAACRASWRQARDAVGGSRPLWSDTRPASEDHEVPTVVVRGSCACGKARYSFPLVAESSEVQHCYCQLCRQLSGSAYQTWIPVNGSEWQWETTPPPPLIRTTPHGQRHICQSCDSVLTIVYDDVPEMVWPAAGGLLDASFPADWNAYMGRAIHICCRYRQGWYALPRDGLERVQEAC